MSTLTRKQIKKRLAALDDYEMSVHRNQFWPGETPEAVDREFMRILGARSKLQAMLKAQELSHD